MNTCPDLAGKLRSLTFGSSLLDKAMAKVMARPRALELLASLGAEPTVMGPDEFAAYVKNDDKQLSPVIKSLGL